MIKVISTRLFSFHQPDAASLDSVLAAGMDAVEIPADDHFFISTYFDRLRALARWFAANPLLPWAVQAPTRTGEITEHGGGLPINLLHPDKARRIDSMDEIKRSLDAAYMIPFQYLVLQLAQPETEWTPATLEHGITVLEHLGVFASQAGMKLLLKSDGSAAGQPARLLEFIAAGRFRAVHVALNTTDAQAVSSLHNAIESPHDLVKAVYLTDKQGVVPVWPGQGSVRWPAVRDQIRCLPDDIAVVLSPARIDDQQDAPLHEKINRAFALVA